jgi:DNA-binding MarR family transcriptional regulator
LNDHESSGLTPNNHPVVCAVPPLTTLEFAYMPETHTTAGKSLNLDRYVPALITFLANKLSAGASSCYREHFGVGIVEWRLLALLAVENGIPANRMCQVIGLDKAAVSRALKTMEAEKLVTSQPDPEDARRVIITLTTSGQTLHDSIYDVAKARENLLLGDFSTEEIETLIDLLARMNARLDIVNRFDPLAPPPTI